MSAHTHAYSTEKIVALLHNLLGAVENVGSWSVRNAPAVIEARSFFERHPLPITESPGPASPVSPNVEGRDFYELCQAYRHSREIMPHPKLPNTIQAFNDLKEYIKTGKLPWPSYELPSPATAQPISTEEKPCS